MKEKTFRALNNEGKEVEFNVVATFDLNGRHYLFYTDMTNMYTGYYEAKKVKSITNVEEYNLLLSVYNELKINNFDHKFYDYGYTFYNGTNYKMIYDTFDRKRYFFELIDGKYREVTGDILNYFNEKFNSGILFLSDSANTNDICDFNCKTRRVFVKINDKDLAICTNTNIDFNKYQLQQLQQHKEIDLDCFINNPNEIEDIIKLNNFLPIEDKLFFLTLNDLYNDNYKYMDKDYLKNNLANLTIIYNKSNNTNKYDLNNNKIEIFNSEKLGKENYNQVLHEYLHVISNGGISNDFPDGLALTEGITDLLCKEYTQTMFNTKYSGSYPKQETYAKMLCEIVGNDVICKAYFNYDYNILINELNKYTSNEQDSINLLRLINDEFKYEIELGIEAYKNEVTDKNKHLKDTQNNIDFLFSKFFENSKKCPLNEDRIMCSYLDQIRKGNRAKFDYYKEGNTYYTEVNKSYINSKTKSDIAIVSYYFSPGIAMRSNPEDFKLQADGKYAYKTSTGEIMYYDQIPEYVLIDKMDNIINENSRKMNNEKENSMKL